LAAVTAASAQSNVTIGGGMVLGLGSIKTGSTNTSTTLARQTGNLAIKGTEDLGGGLKANFEVQTSIGAHAATSLNVAGAVAGATTLGDRGAYINVQGAFGTVAAGRNNSAVRALFGAMGDVSRLAVVTNGLSAGNSTSTSDAAGGDANAFSIYGDAYSNFVSYTSPTVSGFTASVAVAPVDGNTTATKDTMSYTVQYANGPLAAAYNLTDSRQTHAGQAIVSNDAGVTDKIYIAAVGAYKMTTLLASYDLGVANFGITRQTISLATGVNPGAGTAFTVNVPFGATSIGAGYGNRTNTAVTDLQFGDGVKNTFVGLRHDLSKRTHVQAVYAKIDRQGTSADKTQTHVLLGHSF